MTIRPSALLLGATFVLLTACASGTDGDEPPRVVTVTAAASPPAAASAVESIPPATDTAAVIPPTPASQAKDAEVVGEVLFDPRGYQILVSYNVVFMEAAALIENAPPELADLSIDTKGFIRLTNLTDGRTVDLSELQVTVRLMWRAEESYFNTCSKQLTALCPAGAAGFVNVEPVSLAPGLYVDFDLNPTYNIAQHDEDLAVHVAQVLNSGDISPVVDVQVSGRAANGSLCTLGFEFDAAGTLLTSESCA